MYDTYEKKEEYVAAMERAKRRNLALVSGRKESRAKTAVRLIRSGQFRALARIAGGKLKRLLARPKEDAQAYVPDYFSSERIAVYTAVFGPYDSLLEPLCRPDNCDFFLISDTLKAPQDSAWKDLDLPAELSERMRGMTAAEKNRFCKMMPQLLFPAYRYSVYLDGNIQPVTDLTEFINRLPACGVSAHLHYARDCAYDEIGAIIGQNKAPREAMEELARFLKDEGLPRHYGLLECPVIVRDHQNAACAALMEDWYGMFRRFPYRDQPLLSYVLYKRGILPQSVALLGSNVRRSPSFRRYQHTAK